MTGAPLPPKAVADSGLWEGIDAHTDDGAGFDAGDERVHFLEMALVQRDEALAIGFGGWVPLVEAVA